MSKVKVLINKSPEGFGISYEAHELFLKKAGIVYFKYTENYKPILLKTEPLNYRAAITNAKDSQDVLKAQQGCIHYASEISRDHPALWEVAQELGMDAMNDRFSKLRFVEVDARRRWKIVEVENVEYISIDPNPIPKFESKVQHWYPTDYAPGWMSDPEELILVSGLNRNGEKVVVTTCWEQISTFSAELQNLFWYPLAKLCPTFYAN
jgi:thiol-disulfide isomerase/thioredoxin